MIIRYASVLYLTSILIIVHKTNATLPDEVLHSDNDIKSFWFNYINQTLNLLQDAIDKEMTTNNNDSKTSHLCNKHFVELIAGARKGELWANKSKNYIPLY